jgi:hypothetical protein
LEAKLKVDKRRKFFLSTYDIENVSNALLVRIGRPTVLLPWNQIQIQELVAQAQLRSQGQTQLPGELNIRLPV